MPAFDGSFDGSFDGGAADASAAAADALSVFEQVVALLLAPAQDWENAAIAVRDESVDDAIGVNLDRKYGNAVGLKRDASPLFSTDDDAYRRGIRAQIKTLRAAGQREQLIRIARLILDDSTATLAIRRSGTASLLVQVGGAAVLSTTEAVLVLFLTRAASNGVRICVSSFAVAPASAFLLGTGTVDNTAAPGSGSRLADTRSIDD